MTRVAIAAGTSYDLPGSDEMNAHFARLDAKFAELTREQLRGVKLERIPTLSTVAGSTAAIQVPNSSSGYGLAGPESGYLWRIGRVTVVSNGTDNANWGTPVVSQPVVPATGVAQQNNNPFPVKVVISPNGATITAVTVNGIQVGSGAGTYSVPAAGSISITYSVATPTWVWSAFSAQANPGTGVALYTTSDESAQPRNTIDTTLQCGQGYYPSSRGVFLMPGEGLVAVISAPVQGNVYTITGQVWSVPAEMMGKLQ
jgi:hypothetical protein